MSLGEDKRKFLFLYWKATRKRNPFIVLKKIFIQRGGREGEKRETHQSVASHMRADQGWNPKPETQALGMCPDWELNWWPFALLDDTQPTEP